MKKLALILTILLAVKVAGIPKISQGQTFTHPHIVFKDMSGQTLSADKVIPTDKSIILVFWNSNNPKHLDYLDRLNDEFLVSGANGDTKIVAVSTDKHHSPQKLRAITAAKGWDFEVYVDINQSFSRMYAVCDEQLQSFVFHSGRKSAIDIEKPELLHQDFLAMDQYTVPLL
ncbi:MAG: redoxin domain-containing protein [bacterium]|jgi:alkyl hydroperoxide reductase subunit AhpC